MRNFVRSLMSVALVAVATPAMAATIVFSSGATSVDNGDKTFKAGVGTSEEISVRVSAWTLNGNAINASTLGVYSNGLGVINSQEGSGGGNSHTIDNLNRTDFIILQFSKKVWLDDATFTAYKQDGLNYTDTDATIGYGTTAKAWNSNLGLTTLTGSGQTSLNSLIAAGNRFTSGNNGTKGTNTRDIDPLFHSGNVWIVSAAMSNPDKYIDSFKFNYLNYTTKMPVPEPATWMMMIAGFGMIGSTMRRRRPAAEAVEATS